MKDFQTLSTELLYKFNELIYFDEPHKYFLNDKELISVTTLIHKYEEEFDENYWANVKALEYGLSLEEVISAWRFINRKGTMKGSIIHDYAENLLLNKVFKYPKDEIYKEFGFDPILPEYKITKRHVDNFIDDSRGKLIPIQTELVIYDRESLVGGMLDILFYNVKAKEIQIWDHKTNKEFTLSTGRMLNDDLYLLENTDLNKYSLQLGLYKYIIEKNTSLKLGKSHIVWYSHNNTNYEVIPTNTLDLYINLIMNKRIDEVNSLS